ncbi:hypothetical protein BS47DRAFT_1484922 [Hydnum rufescens UP504]|uniref:Uncharacterized protein n=1 Tax=Hydnum rufescens UP504 TaxID=1448309 RepID=A0A9P6AZN7_9AGAM|nr:hypothetical protein BS47DRAFT_1484922 [Hydnum rufescens UP504]
MTGTPSPTRGDRTPTHGAPSAHYGLTAQHGQVARHVPSGLQQGPNAQQALTTEQDRLKLTYGDGGSATHPTLAIGGSGHTPSSRAHENGTVAITKCQWAASSSVDRRGGGGPDLDALTTIMQGRRNVELNFGNGGTAKTHSSPENS